jgi:hypothetical protein
VVASEVILDVADPAEDFGEAGAVSVGVGFPEGAGEDLGVGGESEVGALRTFGWRLVVVVVVVVVITTTGLLAAVPLLAGLRGTGGVVSRACR